MEFVLYQSDNIILKVDKNGNIAYLEIKNGEKPISEKKLNNLIEEAGIIHGFENAKKNRNPNDDSITLAIADKYEKKQEIAYKIDIPVLKEVTLSVLDKLSFVEKGSTIAEKSENLSLSKAKNIFGKPIDDENNTDLSEIIGKGIIVGSTKIVASISGYIYKDENGKINITDRIISENEIRQKNINLKVKLICESGIIKSKIESTEDIIIKGKISNFSEILSKKNVEFTSVENSNIIAEQNIIFSGKARDSLLIAGNKIFGKATSIVELCKLKSGKEIYLYNARNQTSLEICITPILKENLINTHKDSKRKDTLQNEIENKFYNFSKDKISPSIIISNSLEKDVYLRIFDKSLLNRKSRQNFSFS